MKILHGLSVTKLNSPNGRISEHIKKISLNAHYIHITNVVQKLYEDICEDAAWQLLNK